MSNGWWVVIYLGVWLSVWKIISSLTVMIKGVIIRTQSKRWFLFHAFHLTDLASLGFRFCCPNTLLGWRKFSSFCVLSLIKEALFWHRLWSLEGVILSFHGHKTHCWNHTQSSYKIALWFRPDLVDTVHCIRSIGLPFQCKWALYLVGYCSNLGMTICISGVN